MKLNKRLKALFALFALFLLALGIRLYFTFQTTTFSGDEAYYVLRQAENIMDDGVPFFHDPLRAVDRTIVRPPLFYYVLSLFSLLLPLGLVAKILPAIFASSMVFVAYLIARQLSESENAAIFAAMLSAFVPVYYQFTTNSISVHSVMIPLMFYMLYCLIRINEQSFLQKFIILLFILPLINASSFIIIAVFVSYVLLVRIEHLRQRQHELELILLSTLYTLWLLFLMYKNAFLAHGPFVIWQNIPSSILSQYFMKTTAYGAISNISILPFFFGLYVIYKSLFKEKNRKIYLLLAFSISVSLMVWLRLIEISVGLAYLGLILSILSAKFYEGFFEYIEKTSFSFLYPVLLVIILVAVYMTSVTASISYASETVNQSLSNEEYGAFVWMSENIDEGAAVLSDVSTGFFISSVAKRKAVVDRDFLLRDEVDELLDDIKTMYTSSYQTEALRLLEQYNIDYIYLGSAAKSFYNISNLKYTENSRCFSPLFNQDGIAIYEVLCGLDE